MSSARTNRTVCQHQPMTTTARQRREPVQERSRQTVTRILDAASELIDEDGVEAATTRAIADRAGVAYPSLYRFFADREEIFDRLLERHVANLDSRELAAEGTWRIAAVEDLIDRELDLHIEYFQEHPSVTRLWFGGRSSPTVVARVREHIRQLGDRMRELLIAGELIPADVEPQAFLLLAELGDRILDLAFRNGPVPDLDVVRLGRTALSVYVRALR